jgi:L-asparaginase/Glu-tRNA(Gln) amidotransferase subunit D
MPDTSDHKMASDTQQSKKILKRSGTSITSEDFNPGKQVRVLVLYIGGTIGMCAKDGGNNSIPK